MPDFVPSFCWFTNWAKMVHIAVSQVKQNQKEQLWKHYFSMESGFWAKASLGPKPSSFFVLFFCFFLFFSSRDKTLFPLPQKAHFAECLPCCLLSLFSPPCWLSFLWSSYFLSFFPCLFFLLFLSCHSLLFSFLCLFIFLYVFLFVGTMLTQHEDNMQKRLKLKENGPISTTNRK